MARASQSPLFARELGLPIRYGLYALLALALMAVDVRYQALHLVRLGVAAVLHPTQEALTRPFLYLDDALEFFARHGELLRDNQHLRAEMLTLKANQQTLAALRSENANLRSLLGLGQPMGYRTQPAEIIQVLPDPFNRKVVIDRGSQHGIQSGLPVADESGLVGQVTRVFPISSEVTLLTSRGQAAPAQSVRSGLRMIVTGMGHDRLLEVRFLDMHADLKEGDLLVTSGLDGIYPAGIPIAQVTSVRPPRETPFASAHCLPTSHVGAHRHVLVLHRENARP